jgi:hypothetical protein
MDAVSSEVILFINLVFNVYKSRFLLTRVLKMRTIISKINVLVVSNIKIRAFINFRLYWFGRAVVPPPVSQLIAINKKRVL